MRAPAPPLHFSSTRKISNSEYAYAPPLPPLLRLFQCPFKLITWRNMSANRGRPADIMIVCPFPLLRKYHQHIFIFPSRTWTRCNKYTIENANSDVGPLQCWLNT